MSRESRKTRQSADGPAAITAASIRPSQGFCDPVPSDLVHLDSVSETVRILGPMMSVRRMDKIERVIAHRIKGVAVVLENLYDHGNIVAVMRTCEGLGVQSVHIVDPSENYRPAKKIGQGAQKWLTVWEHDSAEAAVAHLRLEGYRILATDLDTTTTLDQVEVLSPVALVFGNEHRGISPRMRELSDGTFVVPMLGHTQSLNISCAAALCIFDVSRRYREHLGRPSDLSAGEQNEIREAFYRRAVKRSELHLELVDTPYRD